jgi:CubicO group peptidase (beta-lactamase class C family)
MIKILSIVFFLIASLFLRVSAASSISPEETVISLNAENQTTAFHYPRWDPEAHAAGDHYECTPKLFLDSAELDSFILDQMYTNHIPGVSACIVKEGEIIWMGVYGFADMENNIYVADTTTFMLASVSKTVVGVALMQLYEYGLFDLDDDIDWYLPFNVDNPSCPANPITFRMLMTHRSSLRDNWDILYPLTVPGDSPVHLDYFLEEYLSPGGIYYALENYNDWCPGADYNYSNVGIALVALLAEEINPYALTFDQYCDLFIFIPLEMNETSWFLSGLNVDNVAIPYMYYDNMYHRWPHYGNPVYPAGFLRASSIHLARYLTAFMQYGRINDVRILDSTTVELMTTVQYDNIGLVWFRMFRNNRLLWGHSGSSWGAGTRMFYAPESNTGVIVLSNRDGNSGTWAIMDALFDYADQQTDVDGNEILEPSAYLSCNYPNPFNSSTVIEYALPRESELCIEIFNIRGRMVETLIQGKQGAGYHQVVWDAKDKSSGVYFYRIHSADYTEMRKMVLIK